METTEQNPTKEKILENAIQQFYENGYKKTTIRKIAELTGISHVAVFWHCKNKEILASQLLRRYIEGLIRLVEKLSTLYPQKSKLLLYWGTHYHLITHDDKFALFYSEFQRYANEPFFNVVGTEFYNEVYVSLFQYRKTGIELSLDMQTICHVDMILIEACRKKSIKVDEAVNYMYKIIYNLLSDKDSCLTKEANLFGEKDFSSLLERYDILSDFLL